MEPQLTAMIPPPASSSALAANISSHPHPLTPRTYPPKSAAILRTSLSVAATPIYTPLPASTIATLSPSALRAALLSAQNLITHLRTATAHQRLLHSLHLISTTELQARHQVEADIATAQIRVLRQRPEEYRRRLRRTKRKLAECVAEKNSLRNGEGDGMQALGLLASRVLEKETPVRGVLGSPVMLGTRKRRRDSTISVEGGDRDGTPSPRKKQRGRMGEDVGGLGTPVSPRRRAGGAPGIGCKG